MLAENPKWIPAGILIKFSNKFREDENSTMHARYWKFIALISIIINVIFITATWNLYVEKQNFKKSLAIEYVDNIKQLEYWLTEVIENKNIKNKTLVSLIKAERILWYNLMISGNATIVGSQGEFPINLQEINHRMGNQTGVPVNVALKELTIKGKISEDTLNDIEFYKNVLSKMVSIIDEEIGYKNLPKANNDEILRVFNEINEWLGNMM